MRTVRRAILLPVGAALTIATPAAAQRPALTPADYGAFEALQSPVLSPDGRWLAWSIARVDEDRELRFAPVPADTTYEVPWAQGAVFSPTSRHLAWSIGVSPTERQRLEKAREPVRLGASVRDLTTGRVRTFDAIQRFAFDATGRYVALHGYAPTEPKGRGGDLGVLDLESGAVQPMGTASEFAWSDVGSLVAIVVATGSTRGHAVQVYDPASGRLRPLATDSAAYRQLAWREDAADLAVLRAGTGADSLAHTLLAWRGLDRDTPAELALGTSGLGEADTLGISQHTRPRWSDDGSRIAFGLRPLPRDSARAPADSTVSDSSKAGPATSDSLPGVQIWHTSDVRIFPQQKSAEAASARRTLLTVWHPEDGRVVRIGTDLRENASLIGDWDHAVEDVAGPYPWGAMFGRGYHDVWLIDVATGDRTKALEHVRYSWESPDGQNLLWFDGTNYWSHNVQSGRRSNLTEKLPTSFADTAYDTPTDLLPPHGVGGWFSDDAAVLLYDQFNVWRVAPDGGGGERITHGAEDEVVHRVIDLGRDEDAIDPTGPLYLAIRGEWTEQRGFARIRRGRDVERLVLEDRFLSGLTRADSADILMYESQARDDSPDIFVAGPDLRNALQVTHTNPQAADFAWTRTELIEYASEAGIRLQGTLLYPVNHDPSRRYPMIVYAYEILSPQAHVWENPSERDYYNFTAWTQQGYFVLLPDVVFRGRDPGVSLLEALRPAVGTVADRGLIDAARVGFIGHSWGGYEGAYVATHSDLFAASVAGAPLTDFVSFMGQIHWNGGAPETSHWETGQGRMEVPYWEDPDAHHRNSPIHAVHEMTTPLLLAHGNEDGVVEFFQSTEFYNFARRAGKQVVLLVYEGEDHSFRQKANQIDYHRRILEWFGHYLQGDPAPAWITDGVLLDDLEQEKKRVAKPGGETQAKR